MKKEGRKLCNFLLPDEIYEYLKSTSKNNYMSMTDYIIQMILKEKNNVEKNDIR